MALLFYPVMSNNLVKTDTFTTIVNYTDGAQRINDVKMVHQPIDTLSDTDISNLVKDAKFPIPMDRAIESNIQNHAFEQEGITTVSDYFNHTVGLLIMNILCFLLIYLIVRMILVISLNGVN